MTRGRRTQADRPRAVILRSPLRHDPCHPAARETNARRRTICPRALAPARVRTTTTRRSFPTALPHDDEESPGRAVVDAARRSAPVLADAATSLTDRRRRSGSRRSTWPRWRRPGLVVGHKVRTRISEEFRITVGHILRSMHANYTPGRGAPNVIMVTSARPGEGKSFSTPEPRRQRSPSTPSARCCWWTSTPSSVRSRPSLAWPSGRGCSTCRPTPRCASRT